MAHWTSPTESLSLPPADPLLRSFDCDMACSLIPHLTYLQYAGRAQFGLYTRSSSPILYGVWHEKGGAVGGRILRKGRAIVLQ